MKEALRKGEISAGHARALLAHPDRRAALREVIERQLSVRQTEAMATREPPAERTLGRRPAAWPRPDALALERHLSEQLGLTVKVTFNGKRGVVQFHYTDLDQLDNLLSRLGLQQ